MARPPSIPDKPYFKIGEVAELAGVEPYVLRYWETEFKSIRPEKTRSNQRMYRRRDVELVLAIKRLLYDEGYRIDGAKRRLRELGAGHGAEAHVDAEPRQESEPEREPKHEIERLAAGLREALDALDKIVDEDERT